MTMQVWGAFVVAGICTSVAVAAALARIRGERPLWIYVDVGLVTFVVAAFGVLFGIRWFGQLTLGLPCALWIAQHHGMSPARLFDHFAGSVGLGQSFGRLGCWFAGCCHGGPAPWGMLPHVAPAGVAEGVPVVPVPLIEGALDLGLSAVLSLWYLRGAQTGRVAAAWAAVHGTVRLVLDGWRADLPSSPIAALTWTQLCAAALLAVGLWWSWRLWPSQRRPC